MRLELIFRRVLIGSLPLGSVSACGEDIGSQMCPLGYETRGVFEVPLGPGLCAAEITRCVEQADCLDLCAKLMSRPASDILECRLLPEGTVDPTAQEYTVCGDLRDAGSGGSGGTESRLISASYETLTVCGRRPMRGPTGSARDDSPVVAWLKNAAQLEADSILAFDELAAQLENLGAPTSLVARAHRAARDEAVHARLVARLGGLPAESFSPRGSRAERHVSRLRLALHNAREGSVRETFGALIARYQALHARSLAQRRTWRRIATDEKRHAELAFAIEKWLWPALLPQERARVEGCREETFKDLEASLSGQALEPNLAEIGWPTLSMQRCMLERLRQELIFAS